MTFLQTKRLRPVMASTSPDYRCLSQSLGHEVYHEVLLPPMDWLLIYLRSPPLAKIFPDFPQGTSVPNHSPAGWKLFSESRVLPKHTTRWLRLKLESRSHVVPESSALTVIRPPRLLHLVFIPVQISLSLVKTIRPFCSWLRCRWKSWWNIMKTWKWWLKNTSSWRLHLLSSHKGRFWWIACRTRRSV